MGTAEPAETVDLAGYYRAERVGLVRLAYLLSGSMEEAEDAVQSVFVDAHRRWGDIENHRAYLRRAVVNRIREVQRLNFRRRRLAPEPAVLTGTPALDETWAVICSLPPRQRDVVVLRFYEDLSLAEIATELGRNHATVRSDLRRALNRLRRTIHAESQ